MYSCKFGTFLGDNERTREKEGLIKHKTTSVWTYVNDNVYDFLNPFYQESDDILKPSCDYLAIKLWKEHFLAFSEITQYQPDEAQISPEDHKDSIMKKILMENLLMKKRIAQLEASEQEYPS